MVVEEEGGVYLYLCYTFISISNCFICSILLICYN